MSDDVERDTHDLVLHADGRMIWFDIRCRDCQPGECDLPRYVEDEDIVFGTLTVPHSIIWDDKGPLIILGEEQ